MCVDPRGTEVGLICSALEAVYRAGRTRLGRSFHEISDALLPLFIEMVRAPPGAEAADGGADRYDEAPVLHRPPGARDGEGMGTEDHRGDERRGPDRRGRDDGDYDEEEEESAESVEVPSFGVPSPFPAGGEAADDVSSSSSSSSDGGEGVNVGVSDAYMAEMEQKRAEEALSAAGSSAQLPPAAPLQRQTSGGSSSSSDEEGVTVGVSSAYMAEMERKRDDTAEDLEAAARAALPPPPGTLVPVPVTLGAARPPTAAEIESAMTPYVPPPPAQAEGTSSIRGDLDAAAEHLRRASSKGSLSASSGGIVSQEQQQQHDFSYEPVPSSAAVPSSGGGLAHPAAPQQGQPAAAADSIRGDLDAAAEHLRRASSKGSLGASSGGSLPLQQGQYDLAAAPAAPSGGDLAHPAPPRQQGQPPPAAADSIRDDLREGLAQIRRASQAAGPGEATADAGGAGPQVQPSLELESEEMVSARAGGADGDGRLVPSEAEEPQALNLRGGGVDTDSESGDGEEGESVIEDGEVDAAGRADTEAAPRMGDEDDDGVSAAADSDVISEDPSNPFSSAAGLPSAGGDGGNALDDSAAMSRGSHNELQDGCDLDDAMRRSVFSESTDNPFSDTGSFAQVRKKIRRLFLLRRLVPSSCMIPNSELDLRRCLRGQLAPPWRGREQRIWLRQRKRVDVQRLGPHGGRGAALAGRGVRDGHGPAGPRRQGRGAPWLGPVAGRGRVAVRPEPRRPLRRRRAGGGGRRELVLPQPGAVSG